MVTILSEYHFELPADLIAQKPITERDGSRMLIVDRLSGSMTDSQFSKLPSLLGKDDLLVLNNTRVFPARLLGRSVTGAQVEVFLVEEIEPLTWITLARPGKRLRVGRTIDFGCKLSGQMVERSEDGKFVIRFEAVGEFEAVVQEIGRTPLPPYIHRDARQPDLDGERYQTVFAANRGAIAAPTAG